MKYILVVLALIAGYQIHTQSTSGGADLKPTGDYHDKLIMYSLTTCGYCKRKAKELRTEGIPFKEYYIDKDQRRRDELSRKLEKAGFEPRGFGTPIFDAYGYMLPNNPSVDKIVKAREAKLAAAY